MISFRFGKNTCIGLGAVGSLLAALLQTGLGTGIWFVIPYGICLLYTSMLDEEMRKFTEDEGLLYVRNDDSISRPFEEPPIVVNYFFHEEIIPSAKKSS